MKKILFMTPFEPCKRTGGQNFTRLLLEDLSLNNKIDLVMFLNNRVDYEIPANNVTLLKIFYVGKLQKAINSLLLPICFPFFSCRFNLRYLFFLIKTIRKNNYDIIYIDYSQLFIFGLFFKNIKKILMSHDVIYQHYLRKSSSLATRFCMMTESFILRKQDNSRIFTFSEKDSRLLKDKYDIRSFVTSFYLDIPSNFEIDHLYNRIVFFGSWKRPENLEGLVWFIENICDKLEQNIEVVIIGGGLEKAMVDQIDKRENIKYLGFLVDPYKIISESKLLVAPIFHGAGVKVKVIEALASGTAVVGTSVAFEGISSDYSSFMLQAESAETFINSINNYRTTVKDKELFKAFFQSKYLNSAISKYIN